MHLLAFLAIVFRSLRFTQRAESGQSVTNLLFNLLVVNLNLGRFLLFLLFLLLTLGLLALSVSSRSGLGLFVVLVIGQCSAGNIGLTGGVAHFYAFILDTFPFLLLG